MNKGRSNLYQDFLNAVLFHSNNKVFKDKQINLFVILIKDLKVGIFLIKILSSENLSDEAYFNAI